MTLDSAHVRSIVAARTRRTDTWFRLLPWLQPVTAFSADVVMLSLSAVIASWLRRSWDVFPSEIDVARDLPFSPVILIATWLLTLGVRGGYGRHLLDIGPEEFRRVMSGSLLAAGVIGVVCYLFQVRMPRGFVLLAFVIGVPLLIVGRRVARELVHRTRAWFGRPHQVLIAGYPSSVDEVAAALERVHLRGYQTLGALVPHDVNGPTETAAGIPVLGSLSDLSEAATTLGADILFLAHGAVGSGTAMRDLAWDLESHDVQVVVAPSVTDVSADRVRVRPIGGLPFLHVDRPRGANATQVGKRAFDVCGALFLLVVFSPIFVAVSTMIKLSDRGPVFFRHTRIGRNGAPFPCLKFRTMVVDAESLVEEIQKAHGVSALLFKLKDDPRITRPGRWLRRYSIDELPQLWNVMVGQMSLVGPRPQVAREVELYSPAMSRRLHVRPGMTGLWQVSGRSDLTADEAVRLDLYYVDNWSMVQDISILARTAGAVFGSSGAY